MSEQPKDPRPRMGMTVAFCDKNRGFSNKGDIPWPHIKRDYDFFMNIITSTVDPGKKNGVLKGRLTWETSSEADKRNPKTSVVVTSTTLKEVPATCRAVVSCYEEGIKNILSGVERRELENIWVLGGREIYQQAINDPRFTLLYVTRIFNDFPVDRYFPEFSHCFHKSSTSQVYTDNGISFQFETWERIV